MKKLLFILCLIPTVAKADSGNITFSQGGTGQVAVVQGIQGATLGSTQTWTGGNVYQGYTTFIGSTTVPTGTASNSAVAYRQLPMVLVASGTASASALVTMASLNALENFPAYKVIGVGIIAATGSGNLLLNVSTATPVFFQQTNYVDEQFRWTSSANGESGGTSDTGVPVNARAAEFLSTTTPFSFEMLIYSNGTTNPQFTYTAEWIGSTNLGLTGAAHWTGSSNVINAIQIKSDAGNLTSGKFYVYGLRNSF